MSSARRTRRPQKQSSLSVVDFCVIKYMMSDLERYSYKDLQTLAKESSCVPANVKREDLIRALDAYQKCDTGKLNTILDEIKKDRIQRMKSTRKKSKTKGSCSKKKKKQRIRAPRKKPMENVNSAYSDAGKEPILYNRLVNHPTNDVYPDSTDGNTFDGNTFDRADRVSYPIMPSGQQPHLIPEYSQRRTLRNITGMDHCYDGPPPLYDFQSSFRKCVSALTPYNAMPPKDLTQNLKEIDPPYVPYLANSLFHPPFMQFPPFNRYNVDNFNSFYKHDNYYPSQLQHPLYYGSSLMPSNNGCDQEQLRICSASQNTFFSKNFNQTSTMDVDCPSCLLPNVPELRTNSENNSNVPVSWSQNSVVPTDSVRNYMPSNPSGHVNYSYQENGPYQSQTNNGTVAGKSQNTEFDSGSDADTVSLAGDFVNLLDLHHDDKRRDTSIESFDLQDFTTFRAKPAYPPETAKYCDTRNTVECRIETCRSNTACYENCNLGENLCNGNGVETQNGNSQLPSFSSLFVDSMINGHPYTTFKHVSQSLSEMPCSSITEKQPSYAANNSVPVNYSQASESNHVDLTSSLGELVPGQNEAVSIPHSQVADSSELQVPSNGNSSEITSSTFNTSILSSTSTEDNEISCSDYMNQIVPFQAQENSVHVPEEAQRAVLDSNSVRQSFNNTSVSEAVFKRDAGSLIYKSEKLHCSKIVCDAVSDSGIKEDIIRELVQIYIPKEKCDTFDSTFSMIKVPSSENNTVKDGMQPSFMPESSLQILDTNTNIPFCHPCKYRFEGCRKIFKIEHLQQHEKVCVFQPVYCPSDVCSWLKCMNLLSKHIYEGHKMELRYRNQFVYTIDIRVNDTDRSFYTFYQVHEKIIYVIRLHINDDKCIATVQYIPEIESTICRSIKRAKGIMKLLSFSKKLQVKTWKGIIQPYLEIENQKQEDNTVQVNINNSDFVSLYLLII